MKNKLKTAIICAALSAAILAVPVSVEALVIKDSNSSAQKEEDTSYASRLKEAQDQIENEEVGSYGMTPIYASDIEDGTYEIEVDSSSPYFKITAAELTVSGDEMTADITISSLSYSEVYMGTSVEAREEEDDWIAPEELDGTSVFTVPVKALNTPIDCAAFSKKKQIWYDRQLVFEAASLPEEAVLVELPDYELIEDAIQAYEVDGMDALEEKETEEVTTEPPEAMDISQADGEYSIEVNMTGGSGRASISSPTLLIVEDGKAYAQLLWSSSYYDYLILDGTYYYNLTTDGGNSKFEIPITAMDEPVKIIGDTTAMGDPVEIEYTLTFYSDSIGAKGEIPQEAAKKVLVIGLAIILVGGVLNYFVKKKRK